MHMNELNIDGFRFWAGLYTATTGLSFSLEASKSYRTFDEEGNQIGFDYINSVDNFDAEGNRISHDERIK